MEKANDKMKDLFDRVVGVVFGVILAFIILGIAIGTCQLFITTWELLKFEGVTGHYITLISDVLTLYVLIELSRSLIEYFHTQRLRLTSIIDGAIVFVIREILIGMFKHELKPEMLIALSVFLFVLGALRFSSDYLAQKEDKSTETNP